MTITITHLNPSGLPRNPGFSQAVAVDGPTRTIYVGGQNAVEPDGTVSSSDAGEQTRRALGNLELVLSEAGARLADVVSWTILMTAGQPLQAAFAAFQEVWGTRGAPPAISVGPRDGTRESELPRGDQRNRRRRLGVSLSAEGEQGEPLLRRAGAAVEAGPTAGYYTV